MQRKKQKISHNNPVAYDMHDMKEETTYNFPATTRPTNRSIFQLLQDRELGILPHKNRKALQQWPAEKTQYHLAHNQFASSEIITDTPIVTMDRCENWLAILESNNCLSLHNIAEMEKAWSLTVENIDEDNHAKLKVAADGTVLCIQENEVQIFFAAQKTGSFPIDRSFYHAWFHMIAGRIFGVSLNNDAAFFYEWNKAGNMAIHGRMGTIKADNGLLTDCNDKYYIASAMTGRPSAALQVAIFNLATNKISTIDLSQLNVKINAISLNKEDLIFGVHTEETIHQQNHFHRKTKIKINANTAILACNMITGELQRHTVNIPGKITKILANDKYIVFFLYANGPFNIFYCFNRQNRTFTEIKLAADFTAASIGDSIHFSFMHNDILVICHPKADYGKLIRYAINLKNHQKIQTTEHLYDEIPPSPFQGNIFLDPKKYRNGNGHSIFIENLNQTPDEKPDALGQEINIINYKL